MSNVPLSAKEALAVRDGRRAAPDGARLAAGPRAGERGDAPRQGSVPPSAARPTAGEPTGRSTGRQPEKNTGENTLQPAAEPEVREEDSSARVGGAGRRQAGPPAAHSAAELFLRSLVHDGPHLAMSTTVVRRLAPLVERWLASGLPLDQIRRTLTQGLTTGVRSAVAVLSWRLEHTLPAVPPPAPAGHRPEPRVFRMRECARSASHTQPRLFTPPPGSGELLCPDCRADPPAAAPADATPEAPHAGPGFARFRAARRRRRTG
ncbi:hypothetical protein [Streptomyces sp. JJ36]|uniref:hypothetical protein n=1 Tax=Streptomyces sp. JJ36 TaxID=2736645 RepID=UPI001F1BDA5E|nr:hypothetical protein [Streptomyces sp. JJ36]MCF6524230.1 hypothetical protein [Streptomyces sp. JJ36]